MGFATDAVHAGQPPEPVTGAVSVPIFQTSTYAYVKFGRHRGFEYARTQNPTRLALERNLAQLEQGEAASAFASGMAAIAAVLSLVKAGDHVVVSDDLYGGTYRLFERVYRQYGLSFTYVPTEDLGAVRRALRRRCQMVFLETPTNPLMRISDLAAIARLAHQRGALLVVDNTFMTPALQKPLELGADLVVHSTTKYLNGHADSVGGAVVARRAQHAEQIRFFQNAAGAILSPFDSFLVLRGIKTLPLRMRCHGENALAVAQFLAAQPSVRAVYYPGLPSHPGHQLAQRQTSGSGGMVSLRLADAAAAQRFCDALRLFLLAESLGGVESLVCHPATMTHASLPSSRRQALGVTDELVRLSVGIEDLEDILSDLKRGLRAAARQIRTAGGSPARRSR